MAASSNGSYSLDQTVVLEIDGTRQRVRLCGIRHGLPPVLVVQGGPGLSLLNETPRFQKLLRLEESFSVAYWEQRGCGPASSADAASVSLESQVDDCCAVIRWLAAATGQRVIVLAISLGATIALKAAARESSRIKAMVAVSIDVDVPAGDAGAFASLLEAGRHPDHKRLARAIGKLPAPPYTTPQSLQARARLMADLGGIEHGKRFVNLLGGHLYSLVRTYGLFGTVATFRNMNAVQRRMLPELATLNLFTDWPRPAVPVHYIFGGKDFLISSAMVQRVSRVITSRDAVVTALDAGHMVHFDEPAMVRSLIFQANEADGESD